MPQAKSREQVVEDAFNAAEEAPDDGVEEIREGAEPEVEEPELEEEPEGEEGEPEAEGDEEPGDEEEPEGEEGDRERDEKGRFAKKPDEEQQQQQQVQQTPEQIAAAAEAAAGAASQHKGLEAWRPGERAALLALKGPEGEAVRAAATRREAQFTAYRQETEQIRGFANEFARRAEPYRPLYTMLNTTPLQAFDVLMRSAAVLYQGDPRMKAQAVAQLIKDRGIDPNIVADFLDGKTSDGRPVPQPDPQYLQVQQELGSVKEQLRQQREQELRARQEQANQFVANWAKGKPWYEDVKESMAMVMQASEAQGRPLTLDQAYATAIQLDPDVAKLERQRLKAIEVKKAKEQAAKAKRAASSPGTSTSAAPRGRSTGDRTRDVEAAWDEHEGRTG